MPAGGPAPTRMPRPSHASQLAQQDVARWEVSCLLWEQLHVTAAEAPMEGSLPCGGAAGTEKVLRLGEAPGLGLRPGASGGGPPGHGAHASFGPDVLVDVWCIPHSQPHSSVSPSIPQPRPQWGGGQMAVPLCRAPAPAGWPQAPSKPPPWVL